MSVESYDIKETLAHSRTTLVRRAVRKADGLPVVLKGLSREYPTVREIGQLEFEYRVLRRLETGGVVRALELEQGSHGPTLVLEDFGGAGLQFSRDNPLPLDHCCDVALAVARALGNVHARGVIHKDVTPGNIVVNPSTREVKLIDFGISSELFREHQSAATASQIEGTLPYISPEQTGRMNRDIDYRTDYYSLGVSLFELLAGSLPFDATDAMGWVHCHISKPPPNVRERAIWVPDALASVLLKLMAKNPGDRYQSARGIIKDIETCKSAAFSSRPLRAFVPGQFDVSERFQVSQTLFGRQQEAQVLRAAFERAGAGRAEMLLVGGYSGVGKSALIHDIQKDVIARHGRFVAGKFDQLERNVPYGALVHAVRSLVKQVLREPEADLRDWAQRVSSALGANARLLVELVPELSALLEATEPVLALPPREAQARFQRVFAAFIEAAATPAHPLVLFLDDLQWADPSTPEFLVYLLSAQRVENVLLIGSYRNNELGSSHLLLNAIREIRELSPNAVVEVSLGPLDEESVNGILAETLRCDRAVSSPLAELIRQKTGGNPFFVKEMLNLLADAGSFRFSETAGHWTWNYDEIKAASVSDNVVELMVQRLQQLPAATLESLRLAACIGSQFDLQTLALLARQPAGNLATALQRAVEERVLVPVGSGYRLVLRDHDYGPSGLSDLEVTYQFQHDRVQQAAYSLLAPEARALAHLRMGRVLLAGRNNAPAEGIFELVNHLNLGRSLMPTLTERLELLGLNEMAGARAKRATAYAMAAAYFDIGLELLSEEEWATQVTRHFECQRVSVECVFYSGDPEGARLRCEALLEQAPDTTCRVAALELEARILDHQARLPEAIATLRKALALLGLILPDDGPELQRQIGEGIGKMQGHLARVPIEDFVKLPEMADEGKVLINSLLFKLVVPAIQANPPLFVLTELLMFDLALTYGTTPLSCKNFVDCGIIQGPVLGDYERAYRLGKVAFEFLKRDASKPLAAAVSFVFATFISHWLAHYSESLDVYMDSERWGLELGDVSHTTYTRAISTQRWFFVGRPLDSCWNKAENASVLLKQARAENQLNGLIFVQRAIARLRGSAADQALLRAESDAAFTARVSASANAQWQFLHGHAELLVSLVMGDFTSAEEWNTFTAAYAMSGGNIHFSFPDHHLFDTLICARRYLVAPEPERAVLLQTMAANADKLATWAKHCPANFKHKHEFAKAEAARAAGEALETVINLYAEAIHSAGDDFVHIRALANERLADYWARAGHSKLAHVYLAEAYSLYEAWGATAKLQQLSQTQPALSDAFQQVRHGVFITQGPRTSVLHANALDLGSMMKATRAIAGEVKRDKVFEKLMGTIIENAGAQRGCLILETAGELRVEASTRSEARPTKSPTIEHAPEVCAQIVRYVARTLDTVVLDDASADPSYQGDPYIARNAVRSALCMPVTSQGELIAILYAENNATTHAFTAERLKLLEVIAAQAAISITNAQLYDNLELKVLERTREVTARNAQVTAMLNGMQQGVFTMAESLEIDPRYSPHLEQILGTADIAGRDGLELLFGGSNVGQDALDTMRGSLFVSFGTPVLFATVNWGHLIREFERRTANGQARQLEVDWSPILDESDRVAKMLVVVRDVTALSELRAAAAKTARELDIVGEILDAGPGAFREFCEGTRASLCDLSVLLSAAERPTRELGERAFRNLHTLKGNARMLGLARLVDAVHHTEELCVGLCEHPEEGGAVQSLFASAQQISLALGEYEDVCRRKLGEMGREEDPRSNQTLELITRLLQDARRGSLAADATLATIEDTLERATAVPLSELVSDAARRLPSLARELGKASPGIECVGVGLELRPGWARIIKDVLVHAFRNSLDHGIESVEARVSKGKLPTGQIVVDTSRGGNGIVIRVRDDGGGLRVEALRRASGDETLSDAAAAERAFLSGVSTATRVSHLSGRGVGLDAVRSFVRQHGGDARIALTSPGRDGYRSFDLVLELPSNAALSEPGWTAPPQRVASQT